MHIYRGLTAAIYPIARINLMDPTNVRDRCEHPDQVIATKSSRHPQETLPNPACSWTKTCPIAEDYLLVMRLHGRSIRSRTQCMESYGSKCTKRITSKPACFSLFAHLLVSVSFFLLIMHGILMNPKEDKRMASYGRLYRIMQRRSPGGLHAIGFMCTLWCPLQSIYS